jgi:hypothetical protein
MFMDVADHFTERRDKLRCNRDCFDPSCTKRPDSIAREIGRRGRNVFNGTLPAAAASQLFRCHHLLNSFCFVLDDFADRLVCGTSTVYRLRVSHLLDHIQETFTPSVDKGVELVGAEIRNIYEVTGNIRVKVSVACGRRRWKMWARPGSIKARAGNT